MTASIIHKYIYRTRLFPKATVKLFDNGIHDFNNILAYLGYNMMMEIELYLHFESTEVLTASK